MTARPRVPAFVAVARSFDDHYLWKKDAGKAWHWDHAWRWIFTNAAWRPSGSRQSRGVVDLKRGQIAVTIRGLAKRFNWSVGAVRYFLRRLREDAMIEMEVISTKISTSSGPRSSYRATLITVCNYAIYQPAAQQIHAEIAQTVAQEKARRSPELPGLLYEIAVKPAKHSRIVNLESENHAERFVEKRRPKHGKRWQGMIFCHYEHEDWRAMAEDFAAVRGTKPFPTRYLDGMGKWFMNAGEATRSSA